MLKKDQKQLLTLFQCDFNREVEENFAKTLSDNENLRLFFINENRAFTDGKNIVVDPATHNLYFDSNALRQTEKWMKIPNNFSSDPWNAMKMITRGQNIHESLHIVYSTFPPPSVKDVRSSTKANLKVLSLISNIIEDAFIESAGCTIYDNLELFLIFSRVSKLFANTKIDGTIDMVLSDDEDDNNVCTISVISEYLNYMVAFLLYPMIAQEEPNSEIYDYVESTKELFVSASICGDPDERYSYSQQIFDIIKPIVPDDEKIIDDRFLNRMLGGLKTHDPNASTIASNSSQGKSVKNPHRLFVDKNGELITSFNFKGKLNDFVTQIDGEKNISIKIVTYQGSKTELYGGDLDCTKLHKNIQIIEKRPKINLNLKKAYQNIYHKYKLNINSYNSRFTQLLKAQITVKEDGFLFGTGISSKRLFDAKKRVWYRNKDEIGIPNLSVLLLIDGSGSMDGARRNSAIISSVILHEVLQKQGIEHAIVEHRANPLKPLIDVNILIDFSGRPEEKYNLMQIDASGQNRDGLAISWCEKYISTKSTASEKLIIVLSDGFPAHEFDEYYPPVSTKDTSNIVSKIIKRGTKVIAVALDDSDSYSCYDHLKDIYPHIISCSDLKHLTGQLLTLVSKQISI